MSGNKSKVVAGLVVGMALGVALAGIVAWYVVNKNPSEFVAKEKQAKSAPQPAPVPASAPVAAPAVNPAPASGVADTKQHFEFYRTLTDKSDTAVRKAPTTKPKEQIQAQTRPQTQHAPAAAKEMYYVQVGSFQNKEDAEKLKAKLAFSGFEAAIQAATIPDKGVWHRVRLGPYNSADAGKTIASLKQNGLIATQVRAQ
jgi:cell division protein FtsN